MRVLMMYPIMEISGDRKSNTQIHQENSNGKYASAAIPNASCASSSSLSKFFMWLLFACKIALPQSHSR